MNALTVSIRSSMFLLLPLSYSDKSKGSMIWVLVCHEVWDGRHQVCQGLGKGGQEL